MCYNYENVDDDDSYDASDDEIYDKEDDVVQAFPAGGVGDQCSQGEINLQQRHLVVCFLPQTRYIIDWRVLLDSTQKIHGLSLNI